VSALVSLALLAQLSAGAIVARVKANDARISDLRAVARMEIVTHSETKTRIFELSLLREGVGYRARIRIREPQSMAGTEFLVHAERGKRNQQWAYFPDLDLVREISGKSQDDAFLGSDITYADLAGGAHLDDLQHRLVGEEAVRSEPCYVMEGVPKHRILYGKLRGYVRTSDFMNVGAVFFDHEGRKIKEALLSDIRELGDGVRLAHRYEIRNADSDRRTVLTLEEVSANQGVPEEAFTESALGKRD
jgi:outer membrane lipoprotein-sorting protein